MPAGSEVLSVEYKVNFMSPGRGERFLASGRVVKAGRTLTICSGEVLAFRGSVETTVAAHAGYHDAYPGEGTNYILTDHNYKKMAVKSLDSHLFIF